MEPHQQQLLIVLRFYKAGLVVISTIALAILLSILIKEFILQQVPDWYWEVQPMQLF